MNDRTILLHVCSRLPDDQIFALYLSSSREHITAIIQDQVFWYLRTQHLVGYDLRIRSGNWKTAYYLLYEFIHSDRTRIHTDLLSTQIAFEVKLCKPSSLLRCACGLLAGAEVVSYLLSQGVDPTIEYENLTPLIIACQSPSIEVVKLLLSDSRVDEATNYNKMLYLLARREMNYRTRDVFKLFLDHPKSDPSSVLDNITLFNCADAMKMIIACDRVDLNKESSYLNLMSSVQHESVAVLRVMIEETSMDLISGKQQLLDDAADNNAIGIVKILLADGRLTPTYQTLYNAVYMENIEVVQILLDDGRIDPTQNDNELLRLAQDNGYKKIVRLLST